MRPSAVLTKQRRTIESCLTEAVPMQPAKARAMSLKRALVELWHISFRIIGLTPFSRNMQSLSFRTECKTTFVCTYQSCNKRFSRIYDLRRHHRGKHDDETEKISCRFTNCPRAFRGFSRKDKRDDHERKKHSDVAPFGGVP